MLWKIVRKYQNHPGGLDQFTLKANISLEEAEAHCKSPDAKSSTATKASLASVTYRVGPWFDAIEEMKPRERLRTYDKDRNKRRKGIDFRAFSPRVFASGRQDKRPEAMDRREEDHI
jgi:hypothetical protein